jgi:hypothetical protein
MARQDRAFGARATAQRALIANGVTKLSAIILDPKMRVDDAIEFDPCPSPSLVETPAMQAPCVLSGQ